MDVLHVTDLHVTAPNTSLENIWTTASDVLRAAKRTEFDFIVVSGDLTQAAQQHEYEQLTRFTDSHLVPRLRPKDGKRARNRIVFVPGNHDVTWFHGTALKKVEPRDLDAGAIKTFLEQPHTSRVRARITKTGELDLRLRDEKEYGRRFDAVQAFLDGFYEKEPPERAFRLVSHDARDHFSAHVFRDEGVAFYGFNTSFHNDEVWRGATLEEDAVTAAVAHAREHAEGLLWVAVWHHGLAGDRGSPDHLIARDLGFLRFNGFHIGMHGHTHVDEFGDLRDILGEQFPVVATGSFGAGQSERPEGQLNQFALLEIAPSYLYIDRYERRPTTQWRRRRLAPYRLRSPIANESRFNDTEYHTTIARLDVSTGFTTITTTYEHITLEQELVLAEPAGPFSNTFHDTHADVDGAQMQVTDGVDADGRRRIKLATRGHYPRVSWSLSASNALACDSADVAMRSRTPLAERLRSKGGWSGYDWLGHRVRVHARELTLAIETNGVPLFEKEHVGLKVIDENDREVPSEASRFDVEVNEDRSRLSVKLERPLLHHRYLLGYQPQRRGSLLSPDLLTLLSDLADVLRSGLLNSPIRRELTLEVENAVRVVLGLEPASPTNDTAPRDEVVWYGYLWNQRSGRLETCFGNCPWLSSGTQFEYGKGVVGQTFRTSQPQSYFKTESSSSLILEGRTPFDWIVAVPLMLSLDSRAIGVIAFAGRDVRGWDRDIRDYAQRQADWSNLPETLRNTEPSLPDNPPATQAKQSEFANNLSQSASIVFWYAIAEIVQKHPALISKANKDECLRIYGGWRSLVESVKRQVGAASKT